MISAAAAIAICILLVPPLVYLWFTVVLVASSAVNTQGWDDAPWWKPFGFYVFGGLEILLAAFFLWTDTYLGIRLHRMFDRGAGQWQAAEPESVKPPPAWGTNRQS
ncbi:MAG: hypothetical protein ABIS47_02065 [Acidimicrobiales bacterium]